MLNAIDNISELIPYVKNKRVGLLTNYTGMNKDFISSVDIINNICDLKVILSPEHGLYGVAQAGDDVENSIHKKTGLPIFSLFNSNKIDEAWIDLIDVLVYDIQDIGLRFYTYIYSLYEAMKLCGKNNISVVVLDRYNPLGLIKKEGTILKKEFKSIVGYCSIPSRYALTVGELSQFFNEEEKLNCKLSVIPCKDLSRSSDFISLGLNWVQTSPNCPTFDTVLSYIGTVLFEGTNISEGRGTTKPFEIFGAPWLKSEMLIKEFNNLGLKGIKFRYTPFCPTFSKYSGEVCEGIQLHITDYKEFNSFECAVKMIEIISKTHKEFNLKIEPDGMYFMDMLLGTDEFRISGYNAEKFIENQNKLISDFDTKKYEIY